MPKRDSDESDDSIVQGVRFANIYASTVYPLVSAWEFEFLTRLITDEEMVRLYAYLDRADAEGGLEHPVLTCCDNPTLAMRVAMGRPDDGPIKSAGLAISVESR